MIGAFIAFTIGALAGLVYQVRKRPDHEPRALMLADRLLLPGPMPMTLAEAVVIGHATLKDGGTCTWCGGPWNAAHDELPHPPWVCHVAEPPTMPIPGDGARSSR